MTKNNFLISLDLKSGDYVFSYNLNQRVADYLKSKKKRAQYKNIMFINNKLFIFLKNSYVIKIKTNGEIEDVIKLPSKIYSDPIIANNLIYFLGPSKKLTIVD